MGIFRFRKFSVENTESAMKVNTDGVLLGVLMSVFPEYRTCLDVGTGTGTVALIAAQRISGLSGTVNGGMPSCSDFRIIGIDIDGPSAREAAGNFSASPWRDQLESVHVSLEDFGVRLRSGNCDIEKFDHIFSNPPYYDMSLRAPDARRNGARHTDTLSYRELAAFSSEFMSDRGILSVILPSDARTWLFRHAAMYGLYPFRTVSIRTTPAKAPSRIVAEFSRIRRSVTAEESLTLHDGPGYTPEYVSLTKDFYLW